MVIGGHAVAAHGFERATRDVDIVYSPALASCERLTAVLAELRAEVMFADQPPRGGGIDALWLAEGGHFRFATESGPLDALSQVAGFDYGALREDAISVELDDYELAVCSYESLIVMKRAGGRPRDEEDIKGLAEARDEPAGQG